MLLGLVLPAASQDQPFLERVDVRVVTVDVLVTDKKGRPIEGLTREDFAVFEDGRPVELTYFQTGYGSSPESPGSLPDLLPTPAPVEAPTLEPLWAVLFVDTLNLEPAHRRRIAGDLGRFAHAHSERDLRFMLASYDTGLHIQTDLPTREEDLVGLLGAFDGKATLGRQDAFEYRHFFQDVKDVLDSKIGICPDPCQCTWEEMFALWDQYAIGASGRLQRSTRGLGELVSALGGLPGRKALFYVSSGLQQRPGIGALNYLTDLCPQLSEKVRRLFLLHDETPHLSRLAASANANRVTLYSLDGAGVRASLGASVEFASRKARPSGLTERMRTANLQSALFYLADETGGEAIFNDNRPLGALEGIVSNFPSYYSLGFSPEREPDGKSHYLVVTLRGRPKAQVKYRHSYQDKTEVEVLGDRLMAALRFGHVDDALSITARQGPAQALENGKYEVPIRITIPLEKLVAVRQAPAKSLVRILLAAQDENGRRTAVGGKMVELRFVRSETEANREVVVGMELGPGPHRVGVGVVDELGKIASFTRILVDATPPEPGL